MKRLTALLFVLALTGCGGTAAAPSAPPSVAAASPTPTPTPSAAPTTAAPTPTAPAASASLIPLPNTAALSAPSGSVVWAIVANSRLFRSTDRGDTWQERPVPQAADKLISFIDDHEGWLATLGPVGAECQTQSFALSHTTDAGATWSPTVVTGIPPAQCKESLSFTDAQHGFLSAGDPNGSPLIYRTTDGGRTWSASRPLPNPPGVTTTTASDLRAGQVRAFGQALLVDVVGQTSGAQRRSVLISGDGGATWSHVSDAPDPISSVAFVTGSRWFQLSGGAVPKETTDSGATWHAFTTDYQQAAPVPPVITFGDAQVGYATVRGAIQRTIDGGTHWNAIRTPGTF